ncbi:SHOCT domain-containing protein [Spongisporangium articulatum]|uniref:SHOCT domain-containing protein n=1 Tax=Spongisporangium articulatum TaxID=3362603 RepID=A0ABW8AU13_9ACTN
MSGWMWLLMGLGQVAFWGALVAGVVLVYRSRGASAASSGQPLGGTPEQVLAGRFARGDIDESEYSHRLGVLHQHAGGPVSPDR